MSTDQFDPEQIVRIRMKIVYVNLLGEKSTQTTWSEPMPRRLAETDVALGSVHLAIEHGAGHLVESAAIVPWTFD